MPDFFTLAGIFWIRIFVRDSLWSVKSLVVYLTAILHEILTVKRELE